METSKHSIINRILHAAIAFCVTLILATIFLRMTWLNKNNIADIIQSYLQSTDQSLSEEQSIILAKEIRQPMWDWHFYIGYILTGLVAIRFFLSSLWKTEFPNPFIKNISLKVKFQNWVYIIFYICLTISLITGLIIEFAQETLDL